MSNRIHLLCAMLLLLAGCNVTPPEPRFTLDRWAVYYNDKLPATAFRAYDVVVFDRQYHPDIKPLLKAGTPAVLAYISAGEIHGDRKKEIQQLKTAKAIIKENKKWGSSVVDLTSAAWRGMVMAQINNALGQGFDGVMLDTLDGPLYASEQISPEFGEANRQAAIQLISDIRQSYPHILLMMNRGLAILPEVSGQLDFILAESILSETNVSTGQYSLISPSTYRQVGKMLRDARRNSPQLKIYTLDYWNQDDVDGTELLYALQRENGFSPYVTTPDLRRLSPEPHSRSRQDTNDAHAENGVIGRGED